MVQQRVDQGAGMIACARVDYQAGGLVDGDQIVAGIENFQRDIFGESFEGFQAGGFDGDALGAMQCCRWLHGMAVDRYVSGFDPILQSGAAELRKVRLQEMIEALSGVGV